MREVDPDESVTAARHNELRDIHHRIDALKEENERQFHSITKDLHALEVAVAKGGRFPAAAWVAAVSLGITVIGTGAMLYSKLETTYLIAKQAVEAIESHVNEMVPAQALVWQMDERIKGLEGKIVGTGPNGWHRADHDLYAKMMDERNERIKIRLDAIEKKQELICDTMRDCKK
jgi:hypothetical protein